MEVPETALGHRDITFPWRINFTNPSETVYSEEVLFRNNCNIRLRAEKSGAKYLIFGELLSTPTERTTMAYRLSVLDPRRIEKVFVTNSFLVGNSECCFMESFEKEAIKRYLFAEDGLTIQCSFVTVDDIEDAIIRLSALSAH